MPIGRCLIARRPNAKFTMARVPVIAVNIDVMRPIVTVIAMPFITPEPRLNKINITIKVVMFASKIVVKALL